MAPADDEGSCAACCSPSRPTSSARSARLRAAQVAGELGVRLQVQQFLDDWHYSAVHSQLAKTWDRRRALQAALDLLEINGVAFPKGAKEECLDADEEAVVECILDGMPPPVRERFEEVSRQLLSVLGQIALARRSLEAGEAEGVRGIFEADDKLGVSRKILHKAVVHTAHQVAKTIDTHASWRQRTEDRINRLAQAAEDAERARQMWMATEAQLAEFGSVKAQKARSCLMGLAAGQDQAVLHTAFVTWHGALQKAKAQKDVRQKYEAELAEKEEQLYKMKERQLENVRASLKRQAMQVTTVMLGQCFTAWVRLQEEAKRDGITAEQLEKTRKQLLEAEHSRKANMTKVVARMCSDSVAGSLQASFMAWTQAVEDAKKDREMEGDVKKVEQQLKEHLATQKVGATGVFDRLGACSSEGLLRMAMSTWTQQIEEDRESREMQRALDGANSKLTQLKDRQLLGACKAQSRINRQVQLFICMRILNTWLLATKAERVTRHLSKKIDAKRKQLSGVQTLFKTVAQQLEQGIDDGGEDTARTTIKPIPRKVSVPRASKRSSRGSARGDLPEPGLQKVKGTFSLPDIRQRPMWEGEMALRRER